ncbi:MAG: hypothetical protein ABIK68_22275, partial [bacterium]
MNTTIPDFMSSVSREPTIPCFFWFLRGFERCRVRAGNAVDRTQRTNRRNTPVQAVRLIEIVVTLFQNDPQVAPFREES